MTEQNDISACFETAMQFDTEIFWTIFGAVISGVVVFVVSQLIMEFLIKPHIEYKKLKNRILVSLTYYSNLLTSPYNISNSNSEADFEKYRSSQWATASEEMRKLASEMAVYNKKHARNIHKNLIGLANGTWQYKDGELHLGLQNGKMIEEIRSWLKWF